jgi:excisionase family DNA binding protein
MADPDLTLQEAADELGVHYMTAYRYVRMGLLAGDKTGGVWRISRQALHDFRAGSQTSPTHARRGAPWAERIELRLLAGDERGAWSIVEAALAAGASVEAVLLDIVAPALRSIGERWASGEIDVALEHRASGVTQRLLGRLSPQVARRGRTRGTVVLGAPAGEAHGLVTSIVADVVRCSGWEVSDLGADVPASSFAIAADSADVVAVGVSVTRDECLASAAECCAAVRAVRPDVLLLLGGRAVRDRRHAQVVAADVIVDDAHDLGRLLAEQLATRRARASGSPVDEGNTRSIR